MPPHLSKAVDATDPQALFDRGFALHQQQRHAEAEAVYRQVLSLAPGHAATLNNLGMMVQAQRRLEEAKACYLQALEADPAYVDALNNLGTLHMDRDEPEAAAACYLRVLELRPDFALGLSNLGGAYVTLERLPQALDAYERAYRLAPDFLYALGKADHLRRHLCQWDGLEAVESALLGALARGEAAGVSPFGVLALPGAGFEAQRLVARQRAEHLHGPALARPPLTPPDRPFHHPLRLGYLSADLHGHATAYLLAGVLERHDRSRLRVHAYSYGPARDDPTRQRLEATCPNFLDVHGWSDEAIAQRIAADGIDILVDLKGFTTHSRLGVTALRPAPVIVNWLGYPGSLGHPRLADYLIGDPVVTPVEHAERYSETLALLPHCYQPNDDRRAIGPRPTRAEAGLPAEGFVYCSFNQSYKITPAVFDLWCRLLRETPGAVLWLLELRPEAAANLRREAARRGVDPARLVFAAALPLAEHLGRLQLADLALDTFPVTSHTTGSDALWAGVPLLTRLGETFVSRVAASLLHAVGLPELVVASEAEYFDLALSLARNPERLREIRARLARQRLSAPLFDTGCFTWNLERLYFAMAENRLRDRPLVLQNEPCQASQSAMSELSKQTPRRLNVGCGRNIQAGWINLDSMALPGVDLVADLDLCATTPLPLADASVDEFLLSHVIEHIRNPLPLMQELWRVATPGARMVIRVPHGGSDDAWEDPTHVRAYFTQSFGYFSQPYFWRADYGYRGDWRCERITFVTPRQGLEGLSADDILARINSQRNVVREMVAELVCVKPIRPPERALQSQPSLHIHLID